MKKTTKIISVIMALAVLLTCFGAVSFADDTHEHNYKTTVVAPTCAEKGYTLHVCVDCGDSYKTDYVNAAGHIWGTWVNIDDADCENEGHDQRTCAVCKAVETKTLPLTDHADKNGDNKCDVCGEEIEKLSFILSPYDWFKAFFAFIIEWFRGIFA